MPSRCDATHHPENKNSAIVASGILLVYPCKNEDCRCGPMPPYVAGKQTHMVVDDSCRGCRGARIHQGDDLLGDADMKENVVPRNYVSANADRHKELGDGRIDLMEVESMG